MLYLIKVESEYEPIDLLRELTQCCNCTLVLVVPDKLMCMTAEELFATLIGISVDWMILTPLISLSA
jgi:hypothetical protein